MQNWCCVRRHENNTNLIAYLHQSYCVTSASTMVIWNISFFGKQQVSVHTCTSSGVLVMSDSLRTGGEGDGTPLQYSCLENPMDGGAWWAAVRGVLKSRTQLSNVPFTFHFHALEKEMATHSSVLAWRIPVMAEPGGLPSMGSHRVGHDWSDLAAAAAYFKVKI